MTQNLTIIIKTFEREASLKNLLNSIRKMGLPYKIIIADDSRVSSESVIRANYRELDLEYLTLPYDIGLSAGRNILLDNVKTDFFVLCDDDFVFVPKSNIYRTHLELVKNSFDILGGAIWNYIYVPNFASFVRTARHPLRLMRFMFKLKDISNYIGYFSTKSDVLILTIRNRIARDKILRCDLVNNFFVARTAAIEEIGGWDSRFKLGEHEDFFLRGKQAGLRVGFINDFSVAHYPTKPKENAHYYQYRARVTEFRKLFAQKHKISQFVVAMDDGRVLEEWRA